MAQSSILNKKIYGDIKFNMEEFLLLLTNISISQQAIVCVAGGFRGVATKGRGGKRGEILEY